MDLKKLKFEAGTSGYSALNNKHHAYICPEERADLHICCAASDESTALALRQHVLDALSKTTALQAEVDQLRQQLHDHDRRRDASMELARTLAEGVDSAPTDLPRHVDDPEPAGCPQCFGFEHLDCICHDEHKPCMDIDGANLGLDSGNAPA